MSGQPYRYSTDVDRFRNEYMDSLGLRADLDKMNLEANKTYKETGQLPPVSQMKDTRTTSEILADTEKLKADLLVTLKPLGNANFALAVIQGIEKSPYNSSGSLFTFFAQRAPEIVDQLKKSYRYGIKGDQNDIERFVSFTVDMFTKTKNYTSTVREYFNRPQIDPKLGGASTYDLNKFAEQLKTMADMLAGSARGRSKVGASPKSKVARQLLKISSDLFRIAKLTSDQEFKMYRERFLEIAERGVLTEDDRAYMATYDAMMDLLRAVPSSTRMDYLISQVELSSVNQDQSLMEENIRILIEELGPLYDSDYEREDLTQIFSEIGTLYKRTSTEMPDITTERPSNVLHDLIERNKSIEQQMSQEDADFGFMMNLYPDIIDTNFDDLPQKEQERRILERIKKLKKERGDLNEINWLNALLMQVTNEFDQDQGGGGGGRSSAEEVAYITEQIQILKNEKERLRQEKEQLRKYIEEHDDEFIEDNPELDERYRKVSAEINKLQAEKHRLTGSGLLKRKGRPKGSGIVKPYNQSVVQHTAFDKGIESSPRFVKFGNYLINLRKLHNEDILALKTGKGFSVQDIPSKRISKNLSGIIKKMIGGGVLSFTEVNSLSEPEKVFLHKVAKKSNIQDKFTIPAPSMEKRDKDIHDFEVMKGEILAGNDSRDLVKKFKVHILRLSREGALPKKEVSEIMEDLLELGI